MHAACRLVRFEIAAADELVAREDRQAVVAILSLVCGLEDFEHLLKVEEHLDALAIPEQRIERREKNARISRWPQFLETRRELEILAANPPGAPVQRARDHHPIFSHLLEAGLKELAALREPPRVRERSEGRPSVSVESFQK